MYRFIAQSMEVILKAVLDVSKYIFIALFIVLADGIKKISIKEFDNIFLYCVIMYIIVNIFSKSVCKYNLNKYIKLIISSVIIGTSIVIPIVLINRAWDMYTFILSITFLIIAVKSILYADNGLDKDAELNNFIYSLVGLLIVFIFINIFKDIVSSNYIICFRKYLGIYFIIGFSSLARLNLVEQYEQNNQISINKDKNIVRVNIISLIIIGVSVMAVSSQYLKKSLIFVFTKLVYFFVNVFGWIFNLLFSDKFQKIKEIEPKYKIVSEEEGFIAAAGRIFGDLKEEIKDYVPREVREITATGVKIGIFILVIAIIIISGYVIYKKLNRKTKIEKDFILEEEKDFIFSLDDIKDSFRNIADKLQDVLKDKKLHPIREIYIGCVSKLNDKGIKYRKSYTPNEYSDVIKKESLQENGFDTITAFYNNMRYGNKEITEEQIAMAKEIKDKI